MDMAQEDKQILGVVIRSAKILQAKVHLFVSKYTDEFTINTVNRNVAFAKKHLAENGIEYTVSYAENMKDFDDQLISFANLLEADIIAIVNHREDGINNLLGGNFDQKVITNRAGIPVLIINTKNTTNVGDIFRSFA
jgi:nucleotide-binding universal stress UspA family protein